MFRKSINDTDAQDGLKRMYPIYQAKMTTVWTDELTALSKVIGIAIKQLTSLQALIDNSATHGGKFINVLEKLSRVIQEKTSAGGFSTLGNKEEQIQARMDKYKGIFDLGPSPKDFSGGGLLGFAAMLESNIEPAKKVISTVRKFFEEKTVEFNIVISVMKKVTEEIETTVEDVEGDIEDSIKNVHH